MTSARSSLEVHGTGSPVVFLHGYPLDRRLWQNQIEPLCDSYQVVLVDLPGFGKATPVQPSDMPSMAAFADDLATALDQQDVNEPFTLVGLSMGGYIAFEFWQRHAARLKALVLCHTKATADNSLAIQTRQQSADTALSQGTEAAVAAMLDKVVSEHSVMQDPNLREWLKSVMFDVPPETIATAQLAMAKRIDFTDRLESIEVPALVVAGTDDEIATTETMQRMARAMPNAKFEAIDDVAHLSPIEQPKRFNELLLSFLGSI